ncbi:MAG TPA: SAM-dependent methyltransferase [Polyangiaceae bacterium]|nr:SAM-dependent methyltransferase [Polyangiaceae bacterium]
MTARLVFALPLVLTACGGAAASVPQQLTIPTPPEMHASSTCPKPVGDTMARPKPPEAQRFPASKLTVPAAVQAIVDAADRSADDKALDAGRHPGEMLTFLDLKPGMRVAEIGAGTGYTTELLARAVGPRGKVWAENPSMFLKFVDKPLTERLAKPALKNIVVRVEKDDTLLPPDAKNLDAVVNNLIYHDTVWLGTDRDKMNKAIFDALRHGGEYVIIDHSALEGHGTQDVKTLHRIDELNVIREVEKAGFHHVSDGDFLRNPADTRDWNASPREAGERRGTSDRFVAKFVKP